MAFQLNPERRARPMPTTVASFGVAGGAPRTAETPQRGAVAAQEASAETKPESSSGSIGGFFRGMRDAVRAPASGASAPAEAPAITSGGG
jgi:hypothetical protein